MACNPAACTSSFACHHHADPPYYEDDGLLEPDQNSDLLLEFLKLNAISISTLLETLEADLK